MKKQIDSLEAIRHSVEGFFSTVDDLLEKGKITPADQDWLEKELMEMELRRPTSKRMRVS